MKIKANFNLDLMVLSNFVKQPELKSTNVLGLFYCFVHGSGDFTSSIAVNYCLVHFFKHPVSYSYLLLFDAQIISHLSLGN